LNPRTGKRADPKALFKSAEYFNAAAEELKRSQRVHPKFWLQVPRTVLGAFAAELYLKALLADLIGVIKETHDPAELFRHLPRATQGRLKKRHKELVQKIYPPMPYALLSPDITDLEIVLDMSRNTFVKYRYIHDPSVAGQPGYHLDASIECFRELILSLHPDWAVKWNDNAPT
jgi:hypothetical protein